MSKQIPIASVAFLRKWQLAHRKLTGKMHNIRHASMARILALTDMTPEQVAVVTAHQARVDETLARVTLPPREHQRGAYPPAMYREYAQKLLDGGHAYRCFCADDELSAAYDRHCRAMSQDVVAARIAAGDKHVVRFAAPTEGQTKFCDGVYGDVVVDNETLEDSVIVKADGTASHILTNVVDDRLNGVSHAIRYEHWIINVPVQIHLYAALGWPAPEYSHVKTATLADVIASDVRRDLFADSWKVKRGFGSGTHRMGRSGLADGTRHSTPDSRRSVRMLGGERAAQLFGNGIACLIAAVAWHFTRPRLVASRLRDLGAYTATVKPC